MKSNLKRHRNKSFFSFTTLLLALTMLLSPGMLAQAAEADFASYIVVFHDTVNPAVEAPAVANAYGLQLGYIYQHAIQGMSAMVPAGRLEALRHDPRVSYVVEDMLRTVNEQILPTGIQRIFADDNAEIDIDSADDFRVDVDVAVIDTGIDLQHPDLNVVSSTSCLLYTGSGRQRTYYCGAGGDDDYGHGTHVSGTIAALDDGNGVVGVAPGARLWAVKVCDSSGSCPSSAIIAGVDYVTANAASIEVANMSLGGSGFSQAEYDAIQGAVNAGVAFAVAAGNDDTDAIDFSPGGFDNVLSVSALVDYDGLPGGLSGSTCFSDQDDTLAYFSNWGSAVDVAAPGGCIYSSMPLEDGGYGTMSGTSMASPHAAGALALLASMNNPANATDVFNLYAIVKNNGNYNWVDDSGDGIQEPLLDISNAVVFNPLLVPTTVETPPAAPADLSASATSSSQINLTWTDSDTLELGFKIERCVGLDCTDFAQIATLSSNVTSYASTGLAPETSYSFRVLAYNAAGDSDYSNIASAVTPTGPALPAAPTNLTAAAISRSQINLAWSDNATNEDGFYIESCKGSTCTNFARIATVGPDVTTFANTGLSKNTTYRYRVIAFNAGGVSEYSNIAAATTLRR